MLNVNSSLSRLSAAGLLVAVIAGGFFLGALPIAKKFDDYERQISERESLLIQNRLLASRGVALKEERDALGEYLSARSGFLQGESRELIGAALQDLMKRLAAREGATLSSTQTLTAEDDSGFRKVVLRINMTAEIGAVQAILHSLETSRPLLFIDNLELRATSLRAKRQDDAETPLQLRFDLYGFVGQAGEQT